MKFSCDMRLVIKTVGSEMEQASSKVLLKEHRTQGQSHD